MNNSFEGCEISKEVKVWFIRTQGGLNYFDFSINNYIGLGWNEISSEEFLNNQVTLADKKKTIELRYHEEKRPGLILSQLNNFYYKMKEGDYVLIPSERTKFVRVGILGKVLDSINRKRWETEYHQCHYVHNRCVKWIREIDVSQDIYLSRLIRVQQTVSNISADADIVLRNTYSHYIYDDRIHFSLIKKSEDEIDLYSNVCMQSSIIEIISLVSKLYKDDFLHTDIQMKTAIGSPGFIELIFSTVGKKYFIIPAIIKHILGKAKDEDGSLKTGLLGLMQQINEMVNDYYQRKKLKAEIETEEENRKIDIKLKEAQLDKTIAETREINARAEKLEKENRLYLPTNEEIDRCADEILPHAENLRRITQEHNIICIDDINSGENI